MNRFLQEEVEYAAMEGAERDRINSEKEAKLSQGQTPTVNTQIYDPKQLKDNGYPLSEPTVMPNNHTKEGKLLFANGDPATENTIGRVTELPPAEFMLPTTRAYVKKTDELYGTLRDSASTEDAEMGLQQAYFQYKIYEGFTDNEEEYNRIAWNTADKLERVGFYHLTSSERDDEGLDDRGMIGLQYVMGSMIMRGAKSADEAIRNIGETGANTEQLNAAWESANRAAHRNAEGMVNPVAATNEQAMEDPRYRGAVETYLRAKGEMTEAGIQDLTPEQVLSKGKMIADLFKSNFARMGTDLILGSKNKDLPVGEAMMYLLDVDEAMPFEGADFGRNITGLLTDPTTYLGGAGLLARMGGKLAGKSLAKQALVKAGASGKFGATFGAGYGGLYDIGMQTVEKQSGVREEYDPARFGQATALGGALGYVLGGATSIAPDAIRAGSKWLDRIKISKKYIASLEDDLQAGADATIRSNVDALSAKQEFEGQPIPDNMIDAKKTFEHKKLYNQLLANKERTERMLANKNLQSDEATQESLVSMINSFSEESGPGMSAERILENMEDVADSLADPTLFPETSEAFQQGKLMQDLFSNADNREKVLKVIKESRKLKLIEGGGKGIGEGGAPLELVDVDPDVNAANKVLDKLDDYNDRIEADKVKEFFDDPKALAAHDEKMARQWDLKRENLAEFEYADKSKIRYKKENYIIDSSTWDEDAGEPLYYLTRADGKTGMKSVLASDMPPDLKVISNKMVELAQIAIDSDPKLAANVERIIMDEPLQKPLYNKKPEFLKGRAKELETRLNEYIELRETAGPDTFRGKELKFFIDALMDEMSKRNKK